MTTRRMLEGTKGQIVHDLFLLVVTCWLSVSLFMAYEIVLPPYRGWFVKTFVFQSWPIPVIVWIVLCLPFMFSRKKKQ